MAKQVEKFTIKLDVEGLRDLTGLERTLKNFEKSVAPKTTKQIQALGRSIQFVKKSSTQTIASLRQKERALTAIRNITNVNSRSFRSLGNEINRTREQINKFNLTSKKSGGIGGKIGSGFGSLIASQVLPGRTSQLALAGGQIGGAKGAAIGAAIGAGMDFFGLAKDAAVFAGNIKRLEVALKGVTKTQEEFAKAQRVIASVSDGLNVPIANATKQFTTLSASVIGAGGSVNDAELVFRGVSEAIKATGGDAEDVKSAIRAMSQIFGKGKVSAEELQGQLGERLPGAVVKFAQATGRTLPQLQKDLRDGTVGLNDVMKFVVKLSGDHASAAREMANSTADAGQRMQVALDKLKLSFGEFFQPIGAGFQDIITGFANMVNAALETRTLIRMLELDMGRKTSGSFAMEALQEADRQATQIAKLRAGKYTQEDFELGPSEGNLLNVHSFSIGKQKPINQALYKQLKSEIFRDLLRGKALEEGILSAPVTGTDLTNFMNPTGDDDGKYYQTLQKQLDFQTKIRQEEEKAENDKYNAFLDFQLLSGQITQTKFDQIKLDQEAVESAKKLGLNLDYVKKVLKEAADQSFSDKNLQTNLDFITKTREAEEKAENDKYNAFLDFQLLSGQITQQKYDQIKLDQEAVKKAEQLGINIDYVKEALKGAKEQSFNFKESLKELYDSVTDLGTNIGQYAIGAVDRLADSFVDLMVTGKASFGDLARSILQDLQKMILKALLFQLIFDPFKKAFGLGDGGVVDGGEVVKSAKGNVFAKNKIVPYKYGGVIDRPSIFPLANGGVGLMAEAGSPEAIMPLKRGANGKLGVESSGGMGNVVVNVDAKGTSAQGDDSKSKEMGRLIGVAIEAELVKQKRPGGLLYS
tara:strand:+ start:4225 stop:6831 length:2607 start_codon:yes stop_codon:yes gene_type:complete